MHKAQDLTMAVFFTFGFAALTGLFLSVTVDALIVEDSIIGMLLFGLFTGVSLLISILCGFSTKRIAGEN